MPASVITPRHLLVSDLMNAPNSSDVEGAGSTLISEKRCRSAGLASAFWQAAFSLATMTVGVPVGTAIPFQAQASKPGTPASAIVGTSGAAGISLSVAAPVAPKQANVVLVHPVA